MKPMIHRRGLLIGLGALFAAPAIVRASSLTPVRVLELAADDLYGIGPMMHALHEYRAAWAQQWAEAAPYILGQTVLASGRLRTCVAHG
jgi:hypothetical protein